MLHSENELLESIQLIYSDGGIFHQQIKAKMVILAANHPFFGCSYFINIMFLRQLIIVHKEKSFQKVLLNCRKAIVNIDRISGVFLSYQTLGTRR